MQIAHEKNQKILKERMKTLNKIKGPRVGDFCVHPNGRLDRITHDWGDSLQVGGISGSYYLGMGYISHSGGLEPAILINRFIDTGETRMGKIWFFNDDYATAHNGIYYDVPFRVFKITEGGKNEKGL